MSPGLNTVFLSILLLWVSAMTFGCLSTAEPSGNGDEPIIDSNMSPDEAFDGLDLQCPKSIRDRQKIVSVLYWGFDKKVHRGQLILDRDLEKDVIEVFEVALNNKFSIQSVVPVSHPKFRKDGSWSDDLSMAANNSSGFNYRPITGGAGLSNHALGRAIDINPVQNPYIKANITLPPDAKYVPEAEGTLTAEHPVTKAFLARGWKWGGNWKSLKDYQHFEKPAKNDK